MTHCQKVRHATTDAARRHLKQRKDTSGENKKLLNKLGIYFCTQCGAFHIGHNKLKGKQYAKSGPKKAIREIRPENAIGHGAGMTPMQARFVAEYRKDLNATQAAIRAGYSKKTAASQAERLLRNVEIAAAVAEKTQQQLEKIDLSAERTLEEMRRVAFSNVQDLFDGNGDLIPIHKLTREQSASIASLEVIMKNATAGDGKVDRVLKIKIWDKPKVMEMLGKHFALLTERVHHTAEDALIAALQAGRSRARARK